MKIYFLFTLRGNELVVHCHVIHMRVMVILHHCTVAIHLRGWEERKLESKAVMSFFSHFLFFDHVAEAAVGHRCCRGHLEVRVHVDGDWGAARFRPVGVCCVSHKGGGRILGVFLTQGWLEMATVVTVFITRTRVVLNFAYIALQTRWGRIPRRRLISIRRGYMCFSVSGKVAPLLHPRIEAFSLRLSAVLFTPVTGDSAWCASHGCLKFLFDESRNVQRGAFFFGSATDIWLMWQITTLLLNFPTRWKVTLWPCGVFNFTCKKKTFRCWFLIFFFFSN